MLGGGGGCRDVSCSTALKPQSTVLTFLYSAFLPDSSATPSGENTGRIMSSKVAVSSPVSVFTTASHFPSVDLVTFGMVRRWLAWTLNPNPKTKLYGTCVEGRDRRKRVEVAYSGVAPPRDVVPPPSEWRRKKRGRRRTTINSSIRHTFDSREFCLQRAQLVRFRQRDELTFTSSLRAVTLRCDGSLGGDAAGEVQTRVSRGK